MKKLSVLTGIFILCLTGRVLALEGEDIIRRSQAAFLYQGEDTKIRVLMKLIGKDGRQRVRELTMLRKNYGTGDGEQKYFIYFFKPADIKGMSFMVYKYPKRDDDRWLFIPALNMVRRIAARDKTSSFVGSDFTYEDVSGRDIEDDDHELLKEEILDGRDCYVVKSAPKESDVNYSSKISWIDKTSFLPIKEEYYDMRGELHRVFTADEIRDIKGLPTVVKRTMRNVRSGHRTEVTFVEVDYRIGLPDDLFSERFLKKPPKKWIR